MKEVKFSWGKCPRCGVTDLLTTVQPLEPFCRKCVKKAIKILEFCESVKTWDEIKEMLLYEEP